MSQEIINNALQKTLISPLTSDLLWSQFLEANSYELANMYDFYGQIKNNWNINKNDKSNLIRISESFGYTPNLVIDSTALMSKHEVESIPFRIREKTTYNGYNFILKQLGIKGEVFNYFWNGTKLIKGIDYPSTVDNLMNLPNHYSPFYGINAIKNYSVYVNSNMMLDYFENGNIKYDSENLRIFSLDEISNSWTLDKFYCKIPTSHVGIEYFPSNYYCIYKSSLGFAEENIYDYEAEISLKDYYIDKSMKIIINNIELNTQIIVESDNKEYFKIDGILDDDYTKSYYDKNSGIIHLTFKTIPINYEIIVSYNIDIFMTQDYFYYLEKGMEYNKRCPIIPHSGIFLTADISQAKGSDFYYPNENGYSVPDLKLKALTTSAYNRVVYIAEPFILDSDPLAILDDSILFHLDTLTSESPSISTFKYIASGNRALPIVNDQYSLTLSQDNLMFFYNMNGEDISSIVYDASRNRINGTIHGNITKIDGIIDKSLDFDGNTYITSDLNLNINTNNDYCIGFWFSYKNSDSSDKKYLFEGFMDIYIKYTEGVGTYLYTNTSTTKLVDLSQYADTPIFVCMNIYDNCTKIKTYCFIDGVPSYVLKTSNINNPLISSSPITIGEDFIGLIDNIWMVNKNLTLNEMNYIYNNKITVISHMGNRLNYYPLAVDEIYEDENYILIQSYVNGMEINHEEIILSETESNEYKFNTKFYPILKPYLTIVYKDSLNKDVTIKSNENGQFYIVHDDEVNEMITSSVDFKTGSCILTKETIKSETQKRIKERISNTLVEAYHLVDKVDVNKDGWYRDENFTDKLEIGVDYNEIDTDDSTEHLKINVYYAKNNYNVEVYSTDDVNYYIKNNQNVNVPIYAYNVADYTETIVFSNDGKIFYTTLNNLKNHTQPLKAYYDNGEYSKTTVYSIQGGAIVDNKSTVYADVSLETSKLITKWEGTVNGTNVYAYTLGDITNISVENLLFYSDLSFTSTITFDTNTTPTPNTNFDLEEIAVNYIQTEFDLSLQKIQEKYNNVNLIKYYSSFQYNFDSDLKIVNDEKHEFSLYYWYTEGGISKKGNAIISADGTISGDNILSGDSNFNYTTNTLIVTFETDMNSDVLTSYSYYESLDIDITKPLTLDYKVEKSVTINEIGLEDENHELLAYMTFPNIEFHSIYDNVSVLFAIRK